MKFDEHQDATDNGTPADGKPSISDSDTRAAQDLPGTLGDLPVERGARVTGGQSGGQTVRLQFRVTTDL